MYMNLTLCNTRTCTRLRTRTHTHTHTHKRMYIHIYTYMYIYICMYIYKVINIQKSPNYIRTYITIHNQYTAFSKVVPLIHFLLKSAVELTHSEQCPCTGWRRLTGSRKVQIIFHKRATKYRSLLRKMTHKDKGSYETSPLCTRDLQLSMAHH